MHQLATLHHPLTGAPLAPLGHRRNGSPIWPIMGGSQGVPETGGQQATGQAGADQGQQQVGQPAPQLPTGTPPPVTRPAPTVGANDTAADLASRYTAEELAGLVASLRKENGRERNDAKAQAAQEAADKTKLELAQAIGAALGLVTPEEEVSVDTLQQRITTMQTEGKADKVELEVYRTADKHGANPGALVDSVGFRRAVADLDPAAADFSDKVIEASKQAVQANPLLRATPAVVRTGNPFTGGPGEARDVSTVQPGVDRLRYAYETGQ